MTFSQQPKGLKTVFYVFFKSLKSKKLILRVNLSEFGVSEGPNFFRLKNDPKNTWNMFIGSIRNPMQKFGDGSFFFLFGPFCQLGYQTAKRPFLFNSTRADICWPTDQSTNARTKHSIDMRERIYVIIEEYTHEIERISWKQGNEVRKPKIGEKKV